jgi:F0F1-type ATP synthase assembly protein I
MRDNIIKEQQYSKNEPKTVWRFLAQTFGISFICIGAPAAIGNMVDRLNHTGVLFGLIGATIGLGIALGYIYLSFRHINSQEKGGER